MHDGKRVDGAVKALVSALGICLPYVAADRLRSVRASIFACVSL